MALFRDRKRWVLQVMSPLRALAQTTSLKLSVLKAICSFLNSEGGTLIIGVANEPERSNEERILGLPHDYQSFTKKEDQNKDGFERHLRSLIRSKIGREFNDSLTITFPTKGEQRNMQSGTLEVS